MFYSLSSHHLLPCLHCIGAFHLGVLPPPSSLAGITQSGPTTANRPPTVTLPSLLSGGGLLTDGSSSQLSCQPGMSLSMSLRPVPTRLVSMIQNGRYVEMRDLLGDNAAVGRHMEDIRASVGASVLQMSTRPRVREVTSLQSWICCFLTYLAIGTADVVTRERLAYAVLLVRESLRHGGGGWLEYDRLFRQQAALDPNLQWNVIHPGLQATTILSQRSSVAGSFCTLCQDCDHTAAQCALSQLQQLPTRTLPSRAASSRPASVRICHSWNDGACIHPGTCNYRHICLNCHQASHPARDCHTPSRSRSGPLSARVPSSSAPPRSAST